MLPPKKKLIATLPQKHRKYRHFPTRVELELTRVGFSQLELVENEFQLELTRVQLVLVQLELRL